MRFLDQALRWVNMCCIYGGTSRYSSGTYINWIRRNLSYQGMYLALLALSVWCPVASDYVPRTRIFNFGLAATRNIALKQCRVHANKIKFDWLNKSFACWKSESTLLVSAQPRPPGLLLDDFQNGGSSVEDPGTQQNSRDRFVHGGWKFIHNGGQDKEWEDLGTRSCDWWKTNKMAAKANWMREGRNACKSKRKMVKWPRNLFLLFFDFPLV